MNTIVIRACIIYCLLIAVTACRKEKPPQFNWLNNKRPFVTTRDTTFHFSTSEWKIHPYFGGPGEDSMFYCWSPVFNGLEQENIKEVFIKTKSGSLLPVQVFLSVSQRDSGYLYQSGESLGAPQKILLWWIQKKALSIPDADSAFIKARL